MLNKLTFSSKFYAKIYLCKSILDNKAILFDTTKRSQYQISTTWKYYINPQKEREKKNQSAVLEIVTYFLNILVSFSLKNPVN